MDYAEKAAEYALQDNDLAIKYLAKAIGELQKQVTQQRTWVGLTDEEHTNIQKQAECNQFMSASEFAVRCQVLVEAKLKEKNT